MEQSFASFLLKWNEADKCSSKFYRYYKRINSLVFVSVFNESGPMIHEIPMIIDPKCGRPHSDKVPKFTERFL